MKITLRTVKTPSALKQFVLFPWEIYKDDPNWVPPLIEENLNKLDPKGRFWRTAERKLWIAEQDGKAVGTIAAFIEESKRPNRLGSFGFFESVPDQAVAEALLNTACGWLRANGMQRMRGPYNPSADDEVGILVEGFDTRPAIMEAHTPPYYPAFFVANGFRKYKDMVAMLFKVPAGTHDMDSVLPIKARRMASIVRKNPRLKSLKVRSFNPKDWENEIRSACQIYNAAMSVNQPDFTATSEADFQALARSFKRLIDPDFALIVEVDNHPVGFALALPDYNEALQHLNGRLGMLGMVKLWFYSRKLKRLSLKMLMVRPEYQAFGLGPLISYEIACAGWRKGFRELDGSLMGEENLASLHLQESSGMKIYRRYRIYEKTLSPQEE